MTSMINTDVFFNVTFSTNVKTSQNEDRGGVLHKTRTRKENIQKRAEQNVQHKDKHAQREMNIPVPVKAGTRGLV